MTNNLPSVTQEEINALLDRLQILYREIATARAAIAPLEEQLKRIANEYRKVMGPLQHEVAQLQAELYLLQNPHTDYDEPIIALPKDRNTEKNTNPQVEIPSAKDDPEYVEKDILLQHMVHVLDHMANEDDANLLAQLQGMCIAPTTHLVDVLERIPWGTVWVTRGPQETMFNQQQRLMSWERSLTQQLKSLRRAEERLRHDKRYDLLAQYQQGQQPWQKFLQQAVQQQRAYTMELAAEVQRLRAARAAMGEQ